MLLAGDIGGTKTHLALFSADKGPRAAVAEKQCGGLQIRVDVGALPTDSTISLRGE